MKSLDELYGTKAEGEWISTNEADADAPAFLCTHYDPTSPIVNAVIQKHSRKFRAQIRNEQLPADKDREIVVRAFVECSLKGWRNVSLDGKAALEFSSDNAVSVFMKYSKMYVFVATEAQRDVNYRLEEDDVKNC